MGQAKRTRKNKSKEIPLPQKPTVYLKNGAINQYLVGISI
jgi:hypothetical protein